MAAGIILSRKLSEIGGSVVVIGTPAEETSGAKVNYTADGAFSDIDAVITEPETMAKIRKEFDEMPK